MSLFGSLFGLSSGSLSGSKSGFVSSLCVLAFALPGLGACSRNADETAAPPQAAATEQREVLPNWRDDRLALGKATYESACASCHDTGEQDAPVTGAREQWEGRSHMWQAVLFNHAKSGYLEMPARGGKTALSDESVEAATEYMLGVTYPELPKD